MYIKPTIAPFIIPFFLKLDIDIVLPINMLIPTIIIVTVGIVLSRVFVYVTKHENIINAIIVIAIEITLPINIFFIFPLLLSKFSVIFSTATTS